MNEKIKAALGELAEQVETVIKEAGIELVIGNDGSYVPALKHDAMKTQLGEAQTQVQTLTDQLNTLSQSTEDVDKIKADAQSAVQAAEQAKADAEAKAQKTILEIQSKSALQTQLLAAGADPENVDLLMNEFDIEKINLTEDNKVIGFDDILKPVKEKRAALFVRTTVEGAPPKQGDKKPTGTNPFKKETFNLTEQAKLINEDPEKARKLAAEAGKKI